MLKPGLILIGAPGVALHELLCLALYLDAPLALSDEISYQIAKKFSDIIPVYKLCENFNLNFFVSGLTHLFTNLTPGELSSFFLARPDLKKIEVFHLLEEGQKNLTRSKDERFCSSFLHYKTLVPLDGKWINLGHIGALSYQKHKKALQNILASFMPFQDNAQFFVTQILQHTQDPKLSKEDTLDQIQFLTLSFKGFSEMIFKNIIPAHGLVDVACAMTQACLFQQDALSLLALHHKKPFLSQMALKGIYEPLSPLISLVPKNPHNLTPLIENYFEFNTLNREELIKKANHFFFHKSLF